MKKIYIILMVAAALLFTSILNYSYSFDRNPMESGVDIEEHEGDNEEDCDGGGDKDYKSGFITTDITINQSYDFPNPFPAGQIVRCCLYYDRFTQCPFSGQTDRVFCSRYRTAGPPWVPWD